MRIDRTAAASLTAILILSLVMGLWGCGTAPEQSVCGDTASSALERNGLHLRLTASPRSVRAGRSISLTLVVGNTSKEVKNFTLACGREFDFIAFLRQGGRVWQWSADRSFTQALHVLGIRPGDRKIYKASWSTLGLKPGEYTVEGYFEGAPEVRPRVDVEVSSGGTG